MLQLILSHRNLVHESIDVAGLVICEYTNLCTKVFGTIVANYNTNGVTMHLRNPVCI